MKRVLEANRLFIDAWKFFSKRLPKGSIEQLPGLVATFGNVPVPFLNACFLDSAPQGLSDLEDRISRAVEYTSECKFPWLLPLCNEWVPEGSEEVCRKMGLMKALQLYAMVADPLLPPRREPPDLRYLRVRDLEGSTKIADINCSAYGMPLEWAASIATPALWDERSFPFLGSNGVESVSCAATIALDAVLYVGWVATRPGHQRKGYGEAVMRHSLEEAGAATGLSRTVLHATEAGFPLYRAMGYEKTATFSVYTVAGEEDSG